MIEDENCNGNTTGGNMIDNQFSQYSFSIPDGNTLVLRIITHIEDRDEELAFDWIRLVAESVTNCMANAGEVIGNSTSLCTGESLDVEYFGFQDDPQYTQLLLVVGDDGAVVHSTASNAINFDLPGVYSIYAYNFLNKQRGNIRSDLVKSD